AKVASFSTIPVCAGFGIRAAEDIAAVGLYVSGAIVGSALVEVLERGEDPTPFLKSLIR
ncbi:MAG: tryptophan synthase subunit alpha, partial [Chromatiales bacterium]